MINFDPEQVFKVRRIAVRENGAWRWFSDPVFTTLGQIWNMAKHNQMMPADVVLELDCQRAFAHYPLEDLKIVEAPSKEAMDMAKLEDLI